MATEKDAARGLESLNRPPPSNNTVRVRMLDTTSVMSLHAFSFVQPVMPGHELMSVTTMAFLLENERLGKRAMFDLGTRKDYWNSPPMTLQRIQDAIPGVRIDKDVTEILEEKGVELETINDIIWSHSHWDHMGSPHLFPPTTNLWYGKGTGVFPPFPHSPGSNLNEDDFRGRHCSEIDCARGGLHIGPFPAHDFYGDGSLYLLDTPGHWPGHLCALARTTPDTFVFLGGDICHFAGDFRPSEWIPMPDEVPAVAFRGRVGRNPMPCPGAVFTDHHPQKQNKSLTEDVDVQTTPFYKLSEHAKSTYKDPPTAIVTTLGLQRYFDADPNVLVLLAHDTALVDVLPTFNDNPEKDLNDWKAQGMKEKCHWGWLGELPQYDSKGNVVGPPVCREVPVVEGLWKEGRLIRSFNESP
ncbi:metallo-beta-lactamase superfamily protein [Niveomyces insectorum RCEF 264]|uniref:Metallo-beta-lactamase superfamily protein n=1 Tax=Niveomyces insectorum RCEF 264 TaxID=1081102 RepID=A0A167T8I6_9HYPO|nr:metallo-beta-lactamase superfamily protein [Niveomyces insectorum RCEF 264]